MIFVFICKTDYSKPVKQEVNGTVILPPLVLPALIILPLTFVGQEVHNKDPTVWLVGAEPPKISL